MVTRLGVVGLLAGLGTCLTLASAAPARAEGGAHIANEPAASLLLPYFEVSLPKKIGGKPKGTTTVFTIRNADNDGVLARVNLWSDLGVPVSFFHVYLTGYDEQTLDLSEVLAGRLPQTASAGQDPGNQISPQGNVSGLDINYASCAPFLPPAELPVESIEHLRAAFTGQPSAVFGDQCLGRDYGEKKPIARGYVTVDTVNSCSFLFPGTPGYFDTTTTDQNVLFGDWFIADKKGVFGDALVHLRADPAEFAVGNYTFYARQVDGLAIDHRQPLATNYGARFANDPKDPLFPRGSEAIVWRDPKTLSQAPFDCASAPPFYPLNQEQIVVFDDEENAEAPQLPPVPPLPPESILPFPAATQRVRLGTPEFPISFARGWVYLNLNSFVLGQTANTDDPLAQQGFVTMLHGAKRHPVAVRATALDDANDASHTIFPLP
jgi:hypothetical protein